jgi:hypothetical protein
MKKVRGRTLGAVLAERTDEQIDDRAVRARLLEIFFRVCQTVASAHNQGVIHRDLKPENIMVDDFGVVYVMDWGLAKQLEETADPGGFDSGRTRAGAVMGTPAYMSPEQASGHTDSSDRQTDVFSLGVMLYEILTGVNPFRGETAVDSMKGVMYHDPEAPRTRNKRIDRTLSAITMKAIAKDPFRRYRSAVELADDIRRYREFRPVSAIDPTRIERLSNWSHRRPRMAATAATLGVVLVLGGLVTGYQASMETAMVARAHGLIDEIEENINRIQVELATQEEILARAAAGPERLEAEARRDDLEAQLGEAVDERRTYALAVTGFTILSPDDRAITILRQSILDKVRTHIENRDFVRARATIRRALRDYEDGNLVEFSAAEHELLLEKLDEAERKIKNPPADPDPGSVEEKPSQ